MSIRAMGRPPISRCVSRRRLGLLRIQRFGGGHSGAAPRRSCRPRRGDRSGCPSGRWDGLRSHDAFRGEGSGFCVFNDLAVAILALRRDGLAARAAVIDLDVHQGDGTASIFEDDPAVLTFSMHGANNFPFRKQCSRIDIALADGTGDAEYLRRLREVLPEVLAFRPQVVFYQSGVDTLAGDRLGRLALTLDGLKQRDRLVLEASRGIPLVITLGGGYAEPIERTAEAHANTFRAVLEETSRYATFPDSQTS